MLRTVLPALGFFAALSTGIMLIPMPAGWRFLVCVLIFAAMFGAITYGRRNDEPELWGFWVFATLTSIFQVLPDWFLSKILGVLVFPPDGLFKIGTVSGYMAGLWAIPFFLILISIRLLDYRKSSQDFLAAGMNYKSAVVAGLVALAIFASSEATLWILNSWYAKDVLKIGHVAVYVLLPEFLLGMILYTGFFLSHERSMVLKLIAAFLISVTYTGFLALSYLFIEGYFV